MALRELFTIWAIGSIWVHIRTFFLMPVHNIPTRDEDLVDYSLFDYSFIGRLIQKSKNCDSELSNQPEKSNDRNWLLIFERTYPIKARTRNLSTGENVQKWTRYFLLFFPTRPSDEYDSAPSRKYSRSLLNVFACIG